MAAAACILLLTPIKTLNAASNSKNLDDRFAPQFLQTDIFKIATWQKITQPGAALNIYIEGDGHVLDQQRAIAADPTPRQRTMRQLAALDPAPNVVYMARPCQFVPEDLLTVCERKYWTNARYSKQIVDAIDQALTQIKQQNSTSNLQLIGYSGGATIAVLVAAQRNDIASIRTVAGNLDLAAMDQYHRTAPLTESLNPLAVADKIKHIPQLHFLGKNDRVIPQQVLTNFGDAAQLQPSQMIVLPRVGHERGWVKEWPKLLELVP